MGADVYHCGLGSTMNFPRFVDAGVLGTRIAGVDLLSSVFDVEATLLLLFCFCFLVGEPFAFVSPLDRSEVFSVSCFAFPLACNFFAAGGTVPAEPLDNLSPDRNEETSFTRTG